LAGPSRVHGFRFAKRGYDLILVARHLGRLEALSDTVGTAHGVKVEVLHADLEKESDLGFVDVNRVCTENLIRVDDVMESPKLAG
jgi:uncharacterized protein